MQPYDWQARDLQLLKENDYTSLINIEPGGGKTALSLWGMQESGADVTLIVAPQPTHKNAWLPTADKLDLDIRPIANSGRKAEKQAMEDFKLGYPGTYLTTPQLLTRADTSDWMPDLLIIDEGHYLNNPDKAGQKALQSLAGASGGRMFLSGTAWRNNFYRAWSVMRFLWPHLNKRDQVAYSNYYLWCRDRMTFEEVYTSRRDKWDNPVKVKQWLNEEEPGRLLSEAPCVIIHKKREECCEFHTVARQGYAGFLNMEEPQVIRHTVELTKNQKKNIKDLETQYLAFLNDNPLIVDLPITVQQRIRQICLGEPEVEDYIGINKDGEPVEKQKLWFKEDCKSPFYDTLVDILNEDEGPIVVYLDSQSFAAPLVKRLVKAGFPAFEYSGATKNTRDQELAKFGTTYRVAVVVISAGGTGLDGLQRVSKTEVWLERSVDETNNIQAESRQDRMGGRGQVQRHIIMDSEGYAEGRYSDQITKRLALNETLRKA